MSIVASSEASHIQRGRSELSLYLPAIGRELLALLMKAEVEAGLVFPDVRADSNLRTSLETIIALAGAKPCRISALR